MAGPDFHLFMKINNLKLVKNVLTVYFSSGTGEPPFPPSADEAESAGGKVPRIETGDVRLEKTAKVSIPNLLSNISSKR
jgi:hypothetical protein